MTAQLPTLVATCFALAVGFLTSLVWIAIERPILGLLRCVTDTKVKDKDVQRIQSAVGVVVQADGPTVAGSFAVSGTVLAVLQAWHRGFDWPSVLCATIAIIYILYAGVKSGKTTDPTDEIAKVCTAVRKEMSFRYTGFTMFSVILLVQMVLVIGW
jgi:hypothetical protein